MAPLQRHLLLEAGFARAKGFAFTETFAASVQTRMLASQGQEQMARVSATGNAAGQRTVVPSEGAAIAAEVQAWAERPDAFLG